MLEYDGAYEKIKMFDSCLNQTLPPIPDPLLGLLYVYIGLGHFALQLPHVCSFKVKVKTVKKEKHLQINLVSQVY